MRILMMVRIVSGPEAWPYTGMALSTQEGLVKRKDLGET